MENMQDLLSDPMFIMQAESRSMIPQQYAATLTDQEIQGHLARIEVVNRRSPSPVLESGPASPVVKTQTPILTPVAEPYVEPVVVPAPAATVPGEGVLAPKVVDPNQPTSYADMTPEQFLAQAQNSGNGTSPAGAEFPGLGADYSGILDFDSMMEKRTQGARQGVDAGVLAEQAASGDQRALAEINRRSNVAATVQTPNPADDPYTASPVLEGYHQMPDGSMMPNSEMSSTPVQTLNPADDRYATSPVLADPTKPSPPVAALTNVSPTDTSTGTTGGTTGGSGTVNGGLSATARTASGGSTGNARGSNMAYSKIGTGESLIRIGGAMYSGALQGNGIGAATQEYGSIQDANRASEAEAFKQAEATRLAELRANRVGAGKSGAKATKGAGDLRFGISKLQTALGMIRGSDGSLTGINPSALFDRFLGKTIGNEQEAQRLFLNEIGLDSIMKRVAETKGAISNAEMALFGRQVPNLGSQEIVWERWLQRQMQMAELLLARAEGGITVDPNAPLSATMPGLSGGGTGGSNMADADAIVGI